MIAFAGRRKVGAPAALFAAALFMLHHALWFFAARPLGETLAIFLLVAALAALLVLVTLWAAALEVPYLGGRVNDQAGMLSDGFETELEGRLERLETETGAKLIRES